MGFLDHALEPVFCDMGVDFRGGDIGMAQQSLHAAQIRPAFHQMGGEGMAQHMRRNLGGIQPRFQRQALEQLMQPLPGEKTLFAPRAE